ncbi:glycosyltransferase [Microbispora hainanensis]|uniref:glycosyltransferase n=1 Tax=Microbispora hainanensis TaxID=568844 RepID=UPI002E2A33B9|nr:glycosyltransferase [Microbispora hainanensis]
MRGVNVCEVIKTLDVGGAEVLLVERLLAASRRQAGRPANRYTVVCLSASTEELTGRLRAAGIDVVDLSSCLRLLRPARLVREVRRLRPDVVNLHSPLPAALLRPASRLWHPRPILVSTVHNVRYRTVTMALDRATAWLDSRTVAVSPQVARARTGRRGRGLSTCVHGVRVAGQRQWAERAAATRREWSVPDDALLIVNVANFHPQKNHRLLVEAAAKVVAAEPRALFLLAGSGPLRDATAEHVSRLGLDRVRVVGHVPEAGRLIAAADLLVLSSSYEGLPVVVMEALAAGVPVVSTAVGGVSDLIETGKNGVLTVPGSADALAGGILQALRPDMRARLRAGARESAGQVDIARAAEWFDKLYGEVCTGTNG